MLGVKRFDVVLVEYNDDWQREYTVTKDELEAIMGDNILDIYHVGSTAIKGIAAKPILDVAIAIRSVDTLDLEAMKKVGYEYRGEVGVPGRHFFVRYINGDISTHHIHCYLNGNENYQSMLLFCRYMNDYPEYAEQYNNLKRELSKKYPNNREAYGLGKEDFINKIIVLAKEEYQMV